jgi:microcompartment protein CcmK/EutM
MQLGKITGTLVATQKDVGLEGMKLHVVQLLDLQAKLTNSYLVAVDAIGAGMGEVVLTVGGSSARMATLALDKPVDAAIIAVVDNVEVGGKTIYEKSDAKAGV